MVRQQLGVSSPLDTADRASDYVDAAARSLDAARIAAVPDVAMQRDDQRGRAMADTVLMLVPRPVLRFLVALPLLGACDSGVSGNNGDCNARIRYEGTTYQPHNAVDETAPLGAELGAGDVIGCGDGASAPKVDEVTVYAVKDVPHSIAVKTRGGDWEGTYVAEGVPQSEWPAVLRRP